MSRLVPQQLRDAIISRLAAEAESQNWGHLVQADKTRLLKQWVQRDDIGGLLRPLLGTDAEVRVWLKDVVLKRRARMALPGAEEVVELLFGDGAEVEIVRPGLKPPHCYFRRDPGERLTYLCWERSTNAKHLLWASLRALQDKETVEGALMVIVDSLSYRTAAAAREQIQSIAQRCSVDVRWVET